LGATHGLQSPNRATFPQAAQTIRTSQIEINSAPARTSVFTAALL
jgi:hypothetical protein